MARGRKPESSSTIDRANAFKWLTSPRNRPVTIGCERAEHVIPWRIGGFDDRQGRRRGFQGGVAIVGST